MLVSVYRSRANRPGKDRGEEVLTSLSLYPLTPSLSKIRSSMELLERLPFVVSRRSFANSQRLFWGVSYLSHQPALASVPAAHGRA